MRVSKQVVAEHKNAILEAASSLLRRQGLEDVSVAELMQEAGLTHGGFYRHFNSKEDLIAQALEYLLLKSTMKWESVIAQEKTEPVVAFAQAYLSTKHLTAREGGCFFPTLGPAAARLPVGVRSAFRQPLSDFFDRIRKFFRGKDDNEKRHAAIAVMSSLIGGAILSQMAGDEQLSKEIANSVLASLARYN